MRDKTKSEASQLGLTITPLLKQYYFIDYTIISKGKHKGMVEIITGSGKKVYVKSEGVIRWPKGKENKK